LLETFEDSISENTANISDAINNYVVHCSIWIEGHFWE